MRMVVALDAGAMIATVRRPIGADETSDVVERDLAHLGVAPLLSVIEQISAGTAREEPQDDSLSTYAPRLTKEEDSSTGLSPRPRFTTVCEGSTPGRMLIRTSMARA